MRTSNIIYNSILVAIIAVIAALPFIKVPITVSARGTIRPIDEDNKIHSLVSGRIVRNTLRANNQSVTKGDTLLIITSDVLLNKKRHQDVMHKDYHDQLHDLNIVLRGADTPMRTGLYQMELASLKERMAEIETQLMLAQRELERNEKLFQQGIIPLAEYEKSTYTRQQYQNQLNAAQEQQHATWQSKKRELEQQLASVQTEKATVDIESENYILKAPANGRIVNFQGFGEGNYILQGQHIADISADDDLIAECLVPAASIGFIHPDQPVNFQIDTYNYNQWGMISGTVSDIDYNIITDERSGEAFFRVRCNLNEYHLTLRNGHRAQVGKGNTYTARFHLIDRTLWQLLFDRVDDWFNPALAT